MIKKIWHFDLEPNMGKVDRIVRYTLSIALISSILIVAPTPLGWFVIFPLIAIPIFVSAYVGWDPVYAMFQKKSISALALFRKTNLKATHDLHPRH